MMTPLQIIAHTPTGFASSDPWSPAIDAILAYWWLQETMGEEAFALSQGRTDLMRPVVGLPLERIDWGDWWWYAASAPMYENLGARQHFYHRRFDIDQSQYLDLGQRKTGRVQVNAGPYKNYRRSVMVQQTPLVTWHVVGDRPVIERLLRLCSHIGHKTAQGYGGVARWEVRNADDAETAYHHRPLPVDFAKDCGLPTDQIIHWGLRPPGRLPENQTLCAMPH